MSVRRSTAASTYAAAGVDEEREQLAFARFMRPWLEATEATSPQVESLDGVKAGHFASVLHLVGGSSIAVTTDGVGTKLLIARMARRYDTVGLDCVANNVNDLICLGADPVLLVDYIAIDVVDETVLEQLARGLYEGAKIAGIAIPGGEIAQVGELLATADGHGPVFDLVGTAVGVLPQGEAAIDGSAVVPGDIIIGLKSSGLHSNGYSLARQALMAQGGLQLDYEMPETGRALVDELLEPTRIYVPAVRALREQRVALHGLVNISGGGLLNLARLRADVSYELDNVSKPPPIFELIQRTGGVSDPEMWATFNMGVGACLVIPESSYDQTVQVLAQCDEAYETLGRVTAEPGRNVALKTVRLKGQGDRFVQD